MHNATRSPRAVRDRHEIAVLLQANAHAIRDPGQASNCGSARTVDGGERAGASRVTLSPNSFPLRPCAMGCPQAADRRGLTRSQVMDIVATYRSHRVANMASNAKLFMTGRSQAVRLPKSLRFDAKTRTATK
jgi:hypothetical protein